MVPKFLLLSALVGCSLAAVNADPFVITEHATESVTSSDVENVSFVKFIVVDESPVDQGVFPWGLGFGTPGRIFVDYVDYKEGGDLVTNTTVALIKLSGDTFDAVNQPRAESYIEDSGMAPGMVGLTMEDGMALAPTAGHLLVEVSLFHANSIMWLFAKPADTYDFSGVNSSLEVVVGEGVLSSKENSPQFSSDSSGYLSYTAGSDAFDEGDLLYIAAAGDVAMYVMATTTPLNLYELLVEAHDQAKVYIEGSSLAASTEISVALQNDTSFVAVFDTVATEALLLSPGESGEICLAVADSLALGRDSSVNDTQNVVLPGATGGIAASGSFACGKMQIPDRVPRDISLPNTSFTPLGEAGSSSDASPSSSSSNGCPSLMSLVSVLASIASTVVVAGRW
jgi:hypothetical protein